MNSSVRNMILWFVILALVVMIWTVFRKPAVTTDTPAFSDLIQKVKSGDVADVVINQATGDITGHYKNKDEFHSNHSAHLQRLCHLDGGQRGDSEVRQGQQQRLDVDSAPNLPHRAGGGVPGSS